MHNNHMCGTAISTLSCGTDKAVLHQKREIEQRLLGNETKLGQRFTFIYLRINVAT